VTTDETFHEALGEALKGEASKWWDEHHREALAVGEDMWRRVGDDLAKGDTTTPAVEIALAMDAAEWRAYLDATTGQLARVASERAEMYRLLASLSAALARQLGLAILAL